ncbi:hypothetical protein COOONC_08292 [Cooperia oncophora]
MLAALILCSFVTSALSTDAAILRFSIRPDNVDLGTSVPFEIDVTDNEQGVFLFSVRGLANKWKGQLRGFAILKNMNISDGLALVQFDHPNLNQDTVAVSIKDRQDGHMKITTDQARITVSQSHATLHELEYVDEDENSCMCSRGNCACCAAVRIPDFHHDICVNATYNREAYGLDLSIGVDGHYYTMEISLRNPPPICLDIPFAHDLADICVAFKDLDVSREKRTLSGCIELEAELVHMRVLRLHLGCFVMPI